MKTKTKFILALALSLICVVGLTGCDTNTSMSYSYHIDTGDNIKVTLDTSNGHKISSNLPMEVTKDGEFLAYVAFCTKEQYSANYDSVESGAFGDYNCVMLDENTREEGDYFIYSYDIDENYKGCDYLLDIDGSNTAVMISSDKGYDAVKEVSNLITFSVE